MDLVIVKNRLENYEQMLEYYALMRTKNKMKDFDAKSKEWWEVTEKYFTKELEKSLAQHRVNERNLRYNLEIYQKKNLDFVCGSLTNIKTSNQDEKIEARPRGIAQEDEVQIEKPQELRVGGQEKKEPQINQNQ